MQSMISIVAQASEQVKIFAKQSNVKYVKENCFKKRYFEYPEEATTWLDGNFYSNSSTYIGMDVDGQMASIHCTYAILLLYIIKKYDKINKLFN